MVDFETDMADDLKNEMVDCETDEMVNEMVWISKSNHQPSHLIHFKPGQSTNEICLLFKPNKNDQITIYHHPSTINNHHKIIFSLQLPLFSF